ncbi:Bax inhibitor-1/YccA family protein [Terrihabitans rhizophilus]|jgi:FtsH-binding integral membrane protein|uniref:Bax inhibitor-1/YccA family protein n=1 Tax=Terrihabitans rhizophilus TaxID=3092662 RepID=A0ABU4RMK7_9HYPH|nr:Bax inhibitor-1/YccA family protein [Terrihabitans sp. PJ23]MDX6806062.1 Bax inhibitor-1/YccA family protein [Terrihabitans sp. PJ23]
MANFDRYGNARLGAGARTEAGVIDQGLRSYMGSVYNYMTIGLAITGLVAIGAFMAAVTDNPAGAAAQYRDGVYLTSIGYALFVSPLKWVIMLAPLGMVFFLSARLNSMSVGAAQAAFWTFAGLMGLSLSTIFLVYTGESIARVFFITAAAFGALSLFGYTTKRDLSAFGTFLVMGLFGLIIAMLVNIFLQSSMMQFIISVAGVLVFSGLTAYDTQRIKEMYYAEADGTSLGRMAISGALALYLDFINLFTMLLSLFGNRE